MTAAEVLLVGAGPAGMAAAVRAAEAGKQVVVLDDNPAEGGQIWRGARSNPGDRQAAAWFRKLESSGAQVLAGSRVIGGDPRKRVVHVETCRAAFEISYDQLILATGARELFLPFPGWTLPNVMGVGGLQALVKSGLPVEGKRIVVAGSGPLLLAVAEYLRKRGAIVPVIAEQAAWAQVARFAMHLLGHPNKLRQAIALRARLGGTPYLTGSWVVSALGNERLASVQLRAESGARTIECDYLAICVWVCAQHRTGAVPGVFNKRRLRFRRRIPKDVDREHPLRRGNHRPRWRGPLLGRRRNRRLCRRWTRGSGPIALPRAGAGPAIRQTFESGVRCARRATPFAGCRYDCLPL